MDRGRVSRYRGTKLRANLPQPYINPDFLRLLSQRNPSLLPLPRLAAAPRPRGAHARFLWYSTMKKYASYSCSFPYYSPTRSIRPPTQIISKYTQTVNAVFNGHPLAFQRCSFTENPCVAIIRSAKLNKTPRA